jgi:multisubunit Na+/H+ antiporter MnhB subunit
MRINTAVARNVVIIMAIAAAVAFAPGGGTGAGVVTTVISLAFLAALGWVMMIMYREHRTTLYSLGSRRVALYVAGGVLAITLTGTSRLWSTSTGQVAWLVLIGGAVYTFVAVFISARRY